VLKLEGNNKQALAELKAVNDRLAQSDASKPAAVNGNGASSAFMKLKEKRDMKEKNKPGAVRQQPLLIAGTQPAPPSNGHAGAAEQHAVHDVEPPQPVRQPIAVRDTVPANRTAQASPAINAQTSSQSKPAQAQIISQSPMQTDSPRPAAMSAADSQSGTRKSARHQSDAAPGNAAIHAMPPRIPQEPPRTSYELERTWKEVRVS
jgi:hypothetical protein